MPADDDPSDPSLFAPEPVFTEAITAVDEARERLPDELMPSLTSVQYRIIDDFGESFSDMVSLFLHNFLVHTINIIYG